MTVSLRARLALAFVLLAVLPLGAITVYFYASSLGVLKRAVAAEAEGLAQELETQAETTRAALASRLQGMRGRSAEGRSSAFEEARRAALQEVERAEVDRMVQALLRDTRRERGEVPFALDPAGRLITGDDADRARLAPLEGRGALSGPGASATGDWVVVTRGDRETGFAFGVARPLTEALKELRQTAARNLAGGLALVGVALLGILPLSRRMTQDLTQLAAGAERLASGDLAARVPVRSRDEFGRLAATFNRMAEELEADRARRLQQERLRKELELCRRIQQELLPKGVFRASFGEVLGLSIPAREVGGDFFNYFAFADGQLALLVGDVSGKGVPAALLMANLQATLRARLPLERDLAGLARRLDDELGGGAPGASYLTLVLAVLDGRTRELRYVNAGHNPPLLLRPGRGPLRLDSTGRPLGLLPGGEFEERRLGLAVGDALFLYTDGLSDAESPGGEAFGERLEGLLEARRGDDLASWLARLEDEVHAHAQCAELADDATLVMLRVGAPA
jgi:serine phosphatase RsbU (regulator of sigma subunit)